MGVLSPMSRNSTSKSSKMKSAKISQRQSELNMHADLKKSKALRRGKDKQRQRAVLIHSLWKHFHRLIMAKFQKLLQRNLVSVAKSWQFAQFISQSFVIIYKFCLFQYHIHNRLTKFAFMPIIVLQGKQSSCILSHDTLYHAICY